MTPFSFWFWMIIALFILAGVLSYRLRKLTAPASMVGVLVAIMILVGSGLGEVVLLATFFVLGTAATSFKKDQKLRRRLAEAHESKRTAAQVFANAGVASILSLVNVFTSNNDTVIAVLIAASFASATGDTFSSELGNLYGRRFYNILTLRKDQRGLDGVISLEGTIFGLGGSLIIALIFAAYHGLSFSFAVIVVAGIAGNLFDSVLGAFFERRGYLGNNAVNFLNTALAALVAFVLLK